MTEPDNLILEQLRGLRNDVANFRRGVMGELSDLKLRTAAVEQHLVALVVDVGGINARLVRIDGRLDRIETRLGLIEA